MRASVLASMTFFGVIVCLAILTLSFCKSFARSAPIQCGLLQSGSSSFGQPIKAERMANLMLPQQMSASGGH
jgi:hypothetical protein